MVSQYANAVAVGADHRAYIIFTDKRHPPIQINLPKDPPEKLIPQDKIHVAWALVHSTLTQPLLIISRGSLVYIYSPHSKNRGMIGYLRGHGSAITSISVNAARPHMFCTTSRDCTTRIYDLTLSPMQKPNNPIWPPSQRPSLAGAAHGLQLNEPEGSGLGRCIIVLMGGRSGGHTAAVLGAAFHEHYPLIATCGMDRCVKIWAVKPCADNTVLTSEDKPLFSSSRIHKARILSVTWLQSDILMTHSASAPMRVNVLDSANKKTYLEPGEVAVWRWLGLNRFFPPIMQEVSQSVLRGCASDYQESSSFKILTVYSLGAVKDQHQPPHVLHLFQSQHHDPVSLTTLPNSNQVLVTNIASLKPRKMPTFSEALPDLQLRDTLMKNDAEILSALAEEMRISDGEVKRTLHRPAFVPAPLPGWTLELPQDPGEIDRRLNCAAIARDGRLIVGVGTHSTIWIWRRDSTLGKSGGARGAPA